MAEQVEVLKQDAIPEENCLCPQCKTCLLEAEQTEDWEDAVNMNSQGKIQILHCSGCKKDVEVTLVGVEQ